MIESKHIGKIAWIAILVTAALCIAAAILVPKYLGHTHVGVQMDYEDILFNTDEVVQIDIEIDEDEWQDILQNPTAEEYHSCNVIINGETFYDVAIRTKGNTSLMSIAADSSNRRYSFKLEFDRNVSGQTCWGLDKLVLNNNFADTTNLKEALAYDMFAYLDADASLYNYAEITINGEYWGVYLALEGVEDGFVERNYGAADVEIYKPETMAMGGGSDDDSAGGFPSAPDIGSFSFSDFSFTSFSASGEASEENSAVEADPYPPDGNLADSMLDIIADIEGTDSASGESATGETSFEMPDFDFSDFGGFGGGGANLNYTDDDLDSYSTVWEGAKTDTTDADHRRVVQALKNISEGTDIEEYMNVDNLLRYMAVHNFMVNEDSLSGGMTHNYYLLECGGQLNIVPWDYNLSLGGMGMGGTDADSIVNEPIDDSWSGTDFFDVLLENEEYLARYHEYYRQLVEEYVLGGGFDEFYTRTRTLTDELVRTDPNFNYTYDEYDTAAQILYETVTLRGQSVLGQLDGTIPSTAAGQRTDSSTLIDASDIDVSAMGSFGGGGGGFSFDFSFDFSASGEASSEASGEASAEIDTSASGEASFPDFDFSGFAGFSSDEPQSSSSITSKTVWTLIGCAAVLAAGFIVVWKVRKKG